MTTVEVKLDLPNALAASADLIVSGDPDLLNLKQFLKTQIVTPREASKRVANS